MDEAGKNVTDAFKHSRMWDNAITFSKGKGTTKAKILTKNIIMFDSLV